MSVKSIAKKILVDRKKPIVKITVTQKAPEQVFSKKVYLVTGGGSGIGFEITKKLIKNGAKVIITGRNEEKLKNAAKTLGANCTYKTLDMSNIKCFSAFIDDIFTEYGRIDGLVNNAGVSLHEWDFLKVTPEGFEEQFLTNLKGSFFLTQNYVKKTLETKNPGNVIFISSERGSMAECIPYGLTKASINSLVQGLSYKYYKS
jgi:3-oxoacyl-[acyl-carrier protein] reductase